MPKSVKIPSVAEATRKLAARCAVSEQAPDDLVRKMRSWGMSEPDAAAVMEQLVKNGFVNEARYVQAYVSDKLQYARWGRLKIAQGLRQKGLPPALVQDALAGIDEAAYAASLRQLLQKQWPAVRGRNLYERRAKLVRFAVGRGFEQHLIFDCLDTMPGLGGDGDDELD